MTSTEMPVLTRIGKPSKFNSTELAIIIAEDHGVRLSGMSQAERRMAVDRAQRILEAFIREAEITGPDIDLGTDRLVGVRLRIDQDVKIVRRGPLGPEYFLP
jgi:hypothetical protein